MAQRLLRNPEADYWERSDYPIICEACLGDDPYVRMLRSNVFEECNSCSRPFTVFSYQPGGDALYKKTEVCKTCSELQNACQVCILNLDSGLPVQVNRTALGDVSNYAIPKSDVKRESLADRMARLGIEGESSNGKSRPCDTLLKGPYHKSNRALAYNFTFFARGQWITGDSSQQNLESGYYGVNDLVAIKLLPDNRPQAPKQHPDGADEARQQALAHSGLLPRAVISQQQKKLQHDQSAPVHYYNIPPPPSQETFYPSMDPLRMGALVPSEYEAPIGPAGSGKYISSSERQHHVFQNMHLPSHGQYHQQFYPPLPPPSQQRTPGNNIMLQ